MNREVHVRFSEGLVVKVRWATRLWVRPISGVKNWRQLLPPAARVRPASAQARATSSRGL